MAQVAVLEGRNLIEHYVSRPADDVSQIHGNIYLGKVQNVLPGMEAAFVDIAHAEERRAVPRRRAVRRRGHRRGAQAERRPHRGHPAGQAADRLPGHEEPDRRQGRPPHPGGVAAGPVRRADPQLEDLRHLQAPARRRAQAAAQHPRPGQAGPARADRAHRRRARHRGRAARRHDRCCSTSGTQIEAQGGEGEAAGAAVPRARARRAGASARSSTPTTAASSSTTSALYERGARLRRRRSTPSSPTASSTTTREAEGLPLFERYHVHEQLHKALDRKVWLPSGGSLIIEHTEALTVIDVNTGKNVGTSNLEETVFHNNLEAAEEIAKQLRLRDIGGIIVIDFIDMEIRENRRQVVEAFRDALGPGQDPHPGVRHLRARPGGDDPQAHRRGPADRVRRPSARTARAAASSSTTRCSTDVD